MTSSRSCTTRCTRCSGRAEAEGRNPVAPARRRAAPRACDATPSRQRPKRDLVHLDERQGGNPVRQGIAKASRETAKHHSQRWKSYEASLRYATDVGRDWSLSVRAGLIRTRFDAEDRLFLTRRGDQTRDVGISVSNRALSRGGYLPELTLNCTRTGSNIPLYNRELCKLKFGLRRLF